MNGRVLAAAFALLFFGSGSARADVGEPASTEITRLQASKLFAGVPSVHGSIAEQNLERWKFSSSNLEDRVFTIDAKHYASPVVRETYVHTTAVDPYSLRPDQLSGRGDLIQVLSQREYRDFQHAALVATISEDPLHLTAYFYRGAFAAYEVLEPQKRKYGGSDRFEWRSFSHQQLPAMIKAARSCDNGPDCAAW